MSNIATSFTAATTPAKFAVPARRKSDTAAILQATDLHKAYRKGPVEVPVLRGVGLAVRQGEFLAVVGQSGCGKTTLLHLLGTLDVPDGGEIHFEGQRIDNLPSHRRDWLRNRCFGMIFQFYHLLPEMTTLENVLAPLMITHGVWSYWRQRRQFRQQAAELLAMVGLDHRLKHRPSELSGGEMQRAGHRPLAHFPAQSLAGRRADGQSRPGERPGDHPHLARPEPAAWADDRHGHARPGHRRQRRPHHPPGGRAGGVTWSVARSRAAHFGTKRHTFSPYSTYNGL